MLLQSLNFNNNGIIIKKEKSEQQQIFTEEQINFQKQLASAAKNVFSSLILKIILIDGRTSLLNTPNIRHTSI